MKYLSFLAIPSIVVAASRIYPRQEAQPAVDTEKLDALRASSCLYYTRPDCATEIAKHGSDEKAIQESLRKDHPTCIMDADTPCGKTVAQCLKEFGREADADQAVKDCIIARVVADTPDADAKTQPVDEAQVKDLRASYCLDYTRPDCEKAIGECGPDEAAIQACIRKDHPTCIQDQDSPCGKTVAQCLAEFGKQAGADQAVKDCIIARVVADTPDPKTQPVDETQVKNLRASHCLDYHRPDCEKAIMDCIPECEAGKVCKYKPNEVEYCVRDNHPTCILDESSLCSKAVVECLSEFGQEEDADQAVSDCIIEKVVSGTPDEEDQVVEEDQTADEDKPAAAGPRPTMSAACVKASEDFKNVLDADSHCDDTAPDSTNEVQRRDAATCSAATAAFQKAWDEDGCEAQLQAELDADSA